MKKRISFILLMAILLSCMCEVCAFIDTDGTKYGEAVELLCDLGITAGISEDYFEPTSPLTRAEAVTFVTRIMGLTVSGTDLFADVPQTHWAYSNVYAAYTAGIVRGTSDTTFEPDAPVTYAQAVKMLICLLGYDAQAQAQGGYPAGYLTAAAQLGILKGVGEAETLCRGDMARMLYNALEVPMLVQAKYGDDNYVASETETILSTYLHVSKRSGRITATYCRSMTADKLPSEGAVAIDGEHVLAGKTNAAAYFGQPVTAYVKEDTDKTIVSLRSDKQAKALTINAASVLSATTKTRFVCEGGVDRKEIAYSIAPDAVLVYNGRRKAVWTADDLQFKNGTVTLIESGGAAADVMIVEEYKNYVADGVYAADNSIFLKTNADNRTKLTVEADKVFVFLQADGTPADITKLVAGDVLSVFDGGDVVKIVRSNKSVSGSVSELSDDSVTINGAEYPLDSGVTAELGYTGNFYLDYNDRIAAIDKAGVRIGTYAWIVAADITKGLEANPQLKMFTEGGEMQLFHVADIIRVNDYSVKKEALLNGSAPAAAQQEIDKLYTGGSIVEQLVVYKTNEEGLLTEIRTAANGEMMDSEERKLVFSLDNSNFSGQYLAAALTILGAKYYLNGAKIFSVPNAYTGDNDKEYSVMPHTELVHGDGYNNVMLYDLDVVNSVSVMVMRRAGITRSDLYRARAALVLSVGEGIAGDGSSCVAITTVGREASGVESTAYDRDNIDVIFRESVIANGREETLCTTDKGIKQFYNSIKTTDLRPGDVVKYLVDSSGVITDMCVLLRGGARNVAERGSKGDTPFNIGASQDYYTCVYLYTALDAVGPASYKFTQPNEHVHTFGSAIILEYNTKRQTYKRITKESLRRGDMIFSSRFVSGEELIIRYI